MSDTTVNVTPKDDDAGEQNPPAGGGAPVDGGDDDDDDDAPLGEPGKKALEAEKQKRRDAQRELRAYKNLGLTPEQIAAMAKPPAKPDDKPDVEQIRREAQDEARKGLLRDRVADKIEAKARAFADAEDATAILLRTHKIEDFIDGDKIDVEGIAEALEELGKKKPHLLAQGRRFQGGADGGPRNDGPSKTIDDQIAEAQKANNLQLAIALKQRKSYELNNAKK